MATKKSIKTKNIWRLGFVLCFGFISGVSGFFIGKHSASPSRGVASVHGVKYPEGAFSLDGSFEFNGLKWSQTLCGAYTNGCHDKICSEKILGGRDSDAELVCESIGGRLPTQEEYLDLVKSFDHDPHSLALTQKGLADIRKVFPDFAQFSNIWTSSVDPKNPRRAIVAGGKLGNALLKEDRMVDREKVRCVSP